MNKKVAAGEVKVDSQGRVIAGNRFVAVEVPNQFEKDKNNPNRGNDQEH